MNSSTSSSSSDSRSHRRFLTWVAGALVLSGVVLHLLPWAGVMNFRRSHERAARAVGTEADFLLVGDSRVSPFARNCLMTGLGPIRGLAFTANSVTPIYHYASLRAMHAENESFAPGVVFISVGANNFNANGLHVRREYTLNNLLDLPTLWDFTAAEGDWLALAEGLLSRLLPIYGKRVLITHLQLVPRFPDTECRDLAPDDWEDPRYQKWRSGERVAILDQNYLEIYRRSVFNDYVHSHLAERGLERLIELVRSWDGLPVIVLMPVSDEMNELFGAMVGEAFERPLLELARRLDVEVLDLRARGDYDLHDVNHLSPLGARNVARDFFVPVVERRLAVSPARPSAAPVGRLGSAPTD